MPHIRMFSLDIMYNQVFTLAASKLINKLYTLEDRISCSKLLNAQ